ncbi:lipopolysaccharide heptosyltransferase I [Candidatus Blochmanniella floridana]|uniref:Lipopolysaccharide heptosyltransferase 1 n=1 Tax=Blochmanniella floridana TaxID=203907 RepID=Q7VRK4_BLOFL|nr:lipopolysaccharide heptosyltransferase I [Candidatus Blochmannia floridanus]
MNVLIIKISSMGDIIHTLPAITDASNSIPNIMFDWVIEETFSAIPRWHPSVQQIIPIKLRTWKNNWYSLDSWKEYRSFIKKIVKKEYDVIIDAQGLLKTAIFVTRVAKGIKHGLDSVSATELMSCWFYDHCHFVKKNQHAIERIRNLFAICLQYSVPLSIGKYNIKNFFNYYKNQHNIVPYIIFFCVTTCSKKQWPKLYWYNIIQKALNLGYHIKIPFWTVSEELFVKKIKKHFNQVIILSRLTLQEIAIQILKSTAIISVDTGLSHLAAAFDCPNLTLYGPTDPKLVGTYGGRNQLILKSKSNDMRHLTPDFVWSTFEKNFDILK